MGVCVQMITGDGPKANISKMDRETGYVWIVTRIEPREGLPSRWYIQGVADDEQIALEMCVDETYFIGPLPLNTALPHKRIEWVGAYFPLK